MLIAEDLHKTYAAPGGELTVLRGVSLSLQPGDALAIVGASGSGKSTLLYLLGALERPTSGRVRLGDVDPTTLNERDLAAFRNRRVGFVFQNHCLLPQCTVYENVLLPTIASGTTKDDLTRAHDLLSRVGLRERLSYRPAQLSGGEQQRVALARALIRQPSLLLCDEPTGNLDQRTADSVAALLFDLQRSAQMMLVLVTHNRDLAGRCDRQVALVEGRLTTSGVRQANEPVVADAPRR